MASNSELLYTGELRWKEILPLLQEKQQAYLDGLKSKGQDIRESDFLRGKWAALEDLTNKVNEIVNKRN